MRKRFDRARHGPGWFEVIFGAALSIFLGAVLAASYLMFKPVTRVKELPKDPVPGTVYYIEGSRDYSNARRLSAKMKFFLKGGSVVFNEDELNSAFNPVAATPVPGTEPPPPPNGFSPGAPNFRIHNGLLQIAVPFRYKLDAFGVDQTLLVQMEGTFAHKGESIVYVPKTMYIGSCPVQESPRTVERFTKEFFAKQTIPPEMAEAWSKLADVTIEGSTLRLTMP